MKQDTLSLDVWVPNKILGRNHVFFFLSFFLLCYCAFMLVTADNGLNGTKVSSSDATAFVGNLRSGKLPATKFASLPVI